MLYSYAQELDEIVEALFPLFAGQDRLEPLTVKGMRLPRNAGGFGAPPIADGFLSATPGNHSQCG